MITLWIISYDISNDKIRRKVSRHLQDHGNRVQYSVFECRLNNQQLNDLRMEVSAMIDPETDTIRWYPLCHWCETKINWQGNGKKTDANNYYII